MSSVATHTPKAFVVWFKDLERWDIKHGKAIRFRRAHPDYRPLGDFAEEATEIVHPKSKPDHDWPVYGVNNTEGVFFNQYQKGDKFNAPYKRIRKDWFFHNPTRANVGSLGRVPDVPDDAITSPEYQVWRIREGLPPAFVEILIKTDFFSELIAYHRVGGVKERLFVQNLLDIPIPVLSIDSQNTIIERWNKKQQQIASVRKDIAKIIADLNRHLRHIYRRECIHDVLADRCFAIGFNELGAWDIKSCRASAFRLACPSFRRLGEFVEDATKAVRPNDRPDHTWPIYGVNNHSGVFLSNRQLGRYFKSAYKHIQKDWFIHNPTRCNVGSLGIVPKVPCDAITSPEYPVWRAKSEVKEPLLPGYIAVMIQTPFFLDLVQFNRVGAVKQRMYFENLAEIRIPFLSLSEQHKYVESRENCLVALADAHREVEKTKAEVEAMILGK